MTGVLLTLLKITIIVTLVVDWWDVPSEMYNGIMSRLEGRPTRYTLVKPFSCGVCMTFWSCLVYVLLYERTAQNVFFCFIFAYLEPYVFCIINKVDFIIKYLFR